MFRLNGLQLVVSVTVLLYVTMIADRLFFVAMAEETAAYKIRSKGESVFFRFYINGKEHTFEADDFTRGYFSFDTPYPVLFDPDDPQNACIYSFSGIWLKHIFFYSLAAFAWIMCGSAILAHNEELLIGKGWLKSRKTKAAGSSTNLPAVRKKSRNFKND